jgi:hypothetical protein
MCITSCCDSALNSCCACVWRCYIVLAAMLPFLRMLSSLPIYFRRILMSCEANMGGVIRKDVNTLGSAKTRHHSVHRRLHQPDSDIPK